MFLIEKPTYENALCFRVQQHRKGDILKNEWKQLLHLIWPYKYRMNRFEFALKVNWKKEQTDHDCTEITVMNV